jgi:precorrin-6A/cobalt-precorrin-6A reductase
MPSSGPVLRTVLILGGTAEAVALAHGLVGRARVVTSLAGRTQSPRRPEGELRSGSFGGVEGLVAWLRANRVAALIDATHPFAARMSGNAVEAADATGVPLLRLERPPWQAQTGDDWRPVASLEEAAALLPEGARVLLAIGRQELAPFAARPDLKAVVRTVDPPRELPLEAEVVVDRGPFHVAKERALLRDKRIEWIVSKNAGGAGAAAKLAAARSLGLPVAMVERPVLPLAETVVSVDDALAWLAAHDI